MDDLCVKFSALKKSHIIILFLIAAGVALVAMQMGNFSSNVTIAQARSNPGKVVKLSGQLNTDKQVVYEPEIDPNAFTFWLKDENGDEVKVICVDEKPRDFELSDEVFLTGVMKDDAFVANQILVKCPSKYVEEEIATS